MQVKINVITVNVNYGGLDKSYNSCGKAQLTERHVLKVFFSHLFDFVQSTLHLCDSVKNVKIVVCLF